MPDVKEDKESRYARYVSLYVDMLADYPDAADDESVEVNVNGKTLRMKIMMSWRLSWENAEDFMGYLQTYMSNVLASYRDEADFQSRFSQKISDALIQDYFDNYMEGHEDMSGVWAIDEEGNTQYRLYDDEDNIFIITYENVREAVEKLSSANDWSEAETFAWITQTFKNFKQGENRSVENESILSTIDDYVMKNAAILYDRLGDEEYTMDDAYDQATDLFISHLKALAHESETKNTMSDIDAEYGNFETFEIDEELMKQLADKTREANHE